MKVWDVLEVCHAASRKGLPYFLVIKQNYIDYLK
jgi:hypothetical protein